MSDNTGDTKDQLEKNLSHPGNSDDLSKNENVSMLPQSKGDNFATSCTFREAFSNIINEKDQRDKQDGDNTNDANPNKPPTENQDQRDKQDVDNTKNVNPNKPPTETQITHSKGTVKIVVNVGPEKRPQKPYYHTCKRGLLCIVQLNPKWKDGNKKDNDVLKGFFAKTLGFDIMSFTSYGELDAAFGPHSNPPSDLKEKTDSEAKKIVCLENYYCLLICISGHGDEKGVIIEDKIEEGKTSVHQWRTTDDIKTRFSNETIPKLAGVPKIIILDVCRGNGTNVTIEQQQSDRKGPQKVLPTKSSDFLFIHATTNGYVASIPKEYGSVGIQNVTEVLKNNWENEHLEEMLIDVRMKVAEWKDKEVEDGRQTLETQSTLTKRLMFEKFVV